ncbi:hypothetical protein PsYK624_071200 [Phanerochaete sordida]|uniref:RING-type E3 ubiquitin transferase n=1 Tax=Phanerochaete sordida TaxID=48140 RepID=A0A9P3LE08_9APHY|nr:hypothetical protein PsYK624_071200 [Phanerochaete sordida]
MNAERPATSKARGICKYYLLPGGCTAGRSCKFLHGAHETLTPYDKGKTCRFYAAGFCKRGADCWFVHAQPAASGSAASPSSAPDERMVEDEDDCCCICFEKPVTYGLLPGCSHIFCLQCIKNWRERKGKSEEVIFSGAIKKCPLCRTSSKFVVPSSVFYTQKDSRRAAAIEKYKASMARVPCKFFERSLPDDRYCPFGNDCFYQHRNADGTPYQFQRGVEYYIKQRGRYLDAEGAPLGRLPQRISLLQSLQDALTRIQTSLDSLPGIPDIPEDALGDADELLAEADIRFSDDGTPFVPPSLITTLAESVMSSLAAFAGEDNLTPAAGSMSHQPPSAQGEPLDRLATAARAFAEEVDNLISDTQRVTSRAPQAFAGELYEVLPRPEAAHPASPAQDLTAGTTGDGDEVVLDYGVAETRPASYADGADEALPATALGEDSAPVPTPPAAEHEPSAPAPAGVAPQDAEALPAGWGAGAGATASEVVYDSDPPFRTDGRGRVVWSSATASPRSRKRRTSTSTPSGTAAAPMSAPLADYVAEGV